MSDAPPFPSPTKRWHTTAQPAASPTRPEVSAKGKSVLVTGGGSTGIGGETARHFAAAGASRIALLGRREKPLLDNKAYIEKNYPHVEVLVYQADVTNEEEVETAFDDFAAAAAAATAAGNKEEGDDDGNQKGGIDVLIHSAAVIGPKETVTAAHSPAEFLESINANVAGAFYVARSMVRHAAPANAVVVAINSWGAHLSLNDGFPAYCVAKMATYRLWDTVAIANKGLTVFHTQPGVIITEMSLRAGGAESFEGVKSDHVSLPASFNLWLASPEARFLNRKFLWCNWDIDELKTRAKEIEEGTELNIDLVGWPWSS